MASTSFNQYDYFKSGTTYDVRQFAGGFITDSSKTVSCSIYLPKLCNGATFSLTSISIRTINGRITPTLSDVDTITMLITENCIELSIKFTAALAVTSNTPVGADIRGTLTFS